MSTDENSRAREIAADLFRLAWQLAIYFALIRIGWALF